MDIQAQIEQSKKAGAGFDAATVLEEQQKMRQQQAVQMREGRAQVALQILLNQDCDITPETASIKLDVATAFDYADEFMRQAAGRPLHTEEVEAE